MFQNYLTCVLSTGVTRAHNVRLYAKWLQVFFPPSSPYLTLTLIFRFGATYVGASKIISMQVCGQKKYLTWISSHHCRRPTRSLLSLSLQEAYPILIGDMDPSGGLQANIIHAPSGELGFSEKMKIYSNIPRTDNLRTKMMVAIQEGKWQNVQMTADYKVGPPKLLPYISLFVFCSNFELQR